MKNLFILLAPLILIFGCGSDGGDNPNPDPKPNPNDPRNSTTGIDSFSEENIYSINTSLPINTAMQGFNFDSDGSIWYTQTTAKEEINWIKGKPNKSTTPYSANSDYMRLLYFGHATNTAVEEEGADRYLWLGAYGSCNDKGQYWTEKVIGRVKYVKGTTVATNECNDYYYIGDYTDMHPSIDAENDLLTINYGDKSNSAFRCFVIYKLSEAKRAPMNNVQITCTDGFQTGKANSTNQVSVVVRAHDLTTLTPIAKPRFLKTGYGGYGATYYDWQGYEVYKDRLYYVEGQSNYNLTGSFYDGTSYAYLTIFDFTGKIIEKRTQIAIVSNKEKLNQIGVSVFGALEAEGVKVNNGKLYIGFCARGITNSDTSHYQNIFVFNTCSK